MAIHEIQDVAILEEVAGGGVSAGEAAGIALGGLGLLVAGIAAAPLLATSAIGWGFGSGIAMVAGMAAGWGGRQFFMVK